MFSFSDFQQRADKVIEHIQQDISTLRTGRANTALLDPVMVEAYGAKMRVHELATVSAPDPTLLTVAPWDKSVLEAIEKAIAASGLNLNPVNDGQMIRIAIPPLTEERRKEMVKLLAQKIEAGKVMLRNLRGDVRKDIENLEGEEGVSEDNIKTWLADLDKKVKDIETEIETIKKNKEAELLKI